MKRSFKNLTIILVFTSLIWIILSNSKTVNENIIIAFDLWVKKVLPSLFPMFVISDILINYNLADILGKYFSKITTKLFKTSGYAAYVFMMSLLSGTPGSAIYVKELTLNGSITDSEASKILTFTFFTNPLFLYNFLSIILNNQKDAILIILISYLSNIFIGLLFRNSLTDDNLNLKIDQKRSNPEFTSIFTNAIKKAMNNLIIILGTITFFIMLSSLIDNITNLNNLNHTIIKGLLEITGGLDNLINLNLSNKLKGVIAGIFISFGGLSIHMQIKAIISDTNISYKPFFIARIIHAIITGLILFHVLK